jgi:uncharacterized protein
MRYLEEQEIRDIANGSAILGTGGGGDPYLGTLAALEAMREFGPPAVLDASELEDDALVAFPFIVGAPVPGVEKFPFGLELVRAFQMLEEQLGRTINAVMPAEIGGANSMIPMSLGARVGLPVVDGDLIGRAFPEIQLTTLTLHGLHASPFALADEHGNGVVLNVTDNFWAERIARAISIEFGAICVGIAYPISGAQAKTATLHGTVSHAGSIGRSVREAKAHKLDLIDAVLHITGGVILFRGNIVDVLRRTQHGWAVGEAKIAGSDEFSGSALNLRFQNENLVAVRDGEMVASVPDLITILDAETGAAITTENLRYGFRVAVIGIACAPIWRTPAGLALAGPQHWGYAVDYVPVESHRRITAAPARTSVN